MNKKKILHYIWKYKLVTHDKLQTLSGKRIEIINPGTEDCDSPIFRDAYIKIDGCERSGNICIESAETTSPSSRLANSTATAVFPEAVGPAMMG